MLFSCSINRCKGLISSLFYSLGLDEWPACAEESFLWLLAQFDPFSRDLVLGSGLVSSKWFLFQCRCYLLDFCFVPSFQAMGKFKICYQIVLTRASSPFLAFLCVPQWTLWLISILTMSTLTMFLIALKVFKFYPSS